MHHSRTTKAEIFFRFLIEKCRISYVKKCKQSSSVKRIPTRSIKKFSLMPVDSWTQSQKNTVCRVHYRGEIIFLHSMLYEIQSAENSIVLCAL